MPLCTPYASVPGQHKHGVIRVQVHNMWPPHVLVFLIRHSVNNGHTAVNAPFFSAPQSCRGGRGVEPDTAQHLRVRGEGCKHTAIFQLFPARLGIFRNHAVFCNNAGNILCRLPASNKTVKHAAGSKCVHRLLPPVATNIKPAELAGQGNANVHVMQRHAALIIFFLCGIPALMVLVHIGQVLQLSLFFSLKPLHMPKM